MLPPASFGNSNLRFTCKWTFVPPSSSLEALYTSQHLMQAFSSAVSPFFCGVTLKPRHRPEPHGLKWADATCRVSTCFLSVAVGTIPDHARVDSRNSHSCNGLYCHSSGLGCQAPDGHGAIVLPRGKSQRPLVADCPRRSSLHLERSSASGGSAFSSTRRLKSNAVARC